MKKLKGFKLTAGLAALVSLGSAPALLAQDNKKDPFAVPDSQISETIKQYNLELSKKIANVYGMLSEYYKLYWYFDPSRKETDPALQANERYRYIEYSPRQTVVEYIDDKGEAIKIRKADKKPAGFKLVKYDFIYPEAKYGVGDPTGMISKEVQMYFSGEKLDKVITIIKHENFKLKTKYTDVITDNNPVTDPKAVNFSNEKKGHVAQVDDIEIFHVYDQGAGYRKKLKDMKMTVSNPHVINWKRDYYLKHLHQFENYFRFTQDFQKTKMETQDEQVIEDLKATTDY